MSTFVGALALSRPSLPVGLAAQLEGAAALSGFTFSRYENAGFVLIHGGLALLPEQDWLQEPDAIAALAGALYFASPGRRRAPLSAASQAVRSGSPSAFAEANGTFALCVYEPPKNQLTLVADSLGARPIYYVLHDGYLCFSTSLTLLERLDNLPRQPEVAACIEEEALCYPLGSRTVYRNIKLLTNNEVLVAAVGRGLSLSRYFDWAQLPLAEGESPEQLAAHVRNALRAAVVDRSAPGSSVTSLLSGGLDSRVLVSELLETGCRVEAVTVAREGFQDVAYARGFAAATGVPLATVPWHAGLAGLTAGETTARLLSEAVGALAPRAVFSGDGGGETLGFLLMDAGAVEELAEGRLRAGVARYLAHYRPLRRLLKAAVFEQVRTAASDRLESELAGIGSPSFEKALHILVLTNDLRCHLHEYFNRIAQTRVELLLPFYDRRVIASVVRIPPPLAPHLGHAFYDRVLPMLSPQVFACPWQTYPGHSPCPVPDPQPPKAQWSARDSEAGDRWALLSARHALRPRFPVVVRRSTVLAACLGHGVRLANYTYLFRSFLNLARLDAVGSSWIVRDDTPAPGQIAASHRLREEAQGGKGAA